MNTTELLAYFNERQPAIIDAIREIVEIESPSFNAEASAAVADWIEARLASINTLEITVNRHISEGIGTHLVIRAFPNPELKPVLVLGHTDTVHPVGAREHNPTRIDGDKFFGGGIFDMKANIVLMIEALRYFAATGTRPARPITIVLDCDEEVGSKTGREHVEREARTAEFCLVFEPSAAGKAKTRRKGTGMYRLNVRGIPAHAGLEPEKGASAILEISHQIRQLHSMNAAAADTTVNVCTATGGTTSNVIPEFAECSVDVRFSSMTEAERIDAAIRDLKPLDERTTLELTGGINRPPMERTDAVVALFQKARDVAASFDYDLQETQVGGASDGNFVGALNIPVLDGLGITGNGAHRLDEHILITDIANRAVLMTMLLINSD
ncbi:MAG: M20 family metallopeptidase [Blastocatellia bacterium]|nr:M20 family metallopeptidase [Blastocatellia bacterium]